MAHRRRAGLSYFTRRMPRAGAEKAAGAFPGRASASYPSATQTDLGVAPNARSISIMGSSGTMTVNNLCHCTADRVRQNQDVGAPVQTAECSPRHREVADDRRSGAHRGVRLVAPAAHQLISSNRAIAAGRGDGATAGSFASPPLSSFDFRACPSREQ
jgi:hypothetical protein